MLGDEKPKTAQEIAAATGAEPELVGELMRLTWVLSTKLIFQPAS